MGIFEHFPYTNFHDLNLNWIISKIKHIDENVAGTAAAVEAAAASAGSALNSAETAESYADAASQSAAEANTAASNAIETVGQVQEDLATVNADLATVNAEMTNFVQAHSGLINETVLWSGSAAAYDAITLSDNLTNYKYIEVYAKYQAPVSSTQTAPVFSDVKRYDPDVLINDNAVITLPYSDSDLIQIGTVYMFKDPDYPDANNRLKVGTSVRVSTDGSAISTAADPGNLIVKIVGVKNIADAEVIDARVGANGTIYQTLEQRLNSENADLKSTLTNVAEQTYNLVSYILTGLSVNGSGGMFNSGTTNMVVAPVVSGETYTIKTDDSSNFVGAFYEQKPTASTTASYNSQRIVSGPKTFTAPITGYVAFRTSNGYEQAQMVEGDADKPYVPSITAVDIVARQTLDTITTTAYVTEPVTGVVTDGKTMGVNGTESEVAGWEYETFQCAEGESYTVITYTGQYMDAWIVFDSSNHYVAFSQLPTTTPIGRQETTFTVPTGGVKFCVNNRKADGSISVVKNIHGTKSVNPNMVLIDDVPLPDVLAGVSGENLLYGKTLCCCGDSITYGADMDAEGFTDESNCIVYQSDANGDFTQTTENFRKTWNWQIANRNNMTLYNAGVNGSTMQGISSRNGFSVANGRYTKLPSNIDYLLIWFGWNDTAYGTLGTISDTTNESYYGGYNVVLPYLINKYPYAKIALIVPFGTDEGHRNAIRLLGNKWGVAVWDNYQGGTPLYYGKEDSVGVEQSVVLSNRAKFQANGAHPNFKGHRQLGDMIEDFLRSI